MAKEPKTADSGFMTQDKTKVDLIYRQAAIKAIEDLHDSYNGFSDTYDKACIIGALEEVPSAQPMQTNDSNALKERRRLMR